MSGGGSRVSRIPLRHRLVAGFVVTMAVLLTASGAFVYWRVQVALDQALDDDLQAAAVTLVPKVTSEGTLPVGSDTPARIDGFQVLDSSGVVVDHDSRLGAAPVIGADLARRATTEPVMHDVGQLLPASAKPLRLYAVPVGADEQEDSRYVLVIAMRRDQHDEALRELLAQLLVAGLGALVLASIVGDLLARAALRPVETYRTQAASIASGATGVRLDVPPGRDDEVTRLGHTLNDMLEALDEAIARERRFINDASHELRTPLTLLTSRVQLMLRRKRTLAEHEAALVEIGEDLAGLTRLTNQLLGLGTAQQTQQESRRGDLAAAATKAVLARTALSPTGSPYGAAGSLTVAATPPVSVGVDDLTLRRIVDNLLDNAALHGRIPVSVAVDTVGDVARLVVTDSGPGMSEDLLRRATERFSRSIDARGRPGSGLGLSLVAAAVDAAQGQLRLCSQQRHHRVGQPIETSCDHGPEMTVTVLLPRLDPADGAQTEEPPSPD